LKRWILPVAVLGSSRVNSLRGFLETEGMRSKTGRRSFADFERELHERMMEAERDIVAGEMARLDVDVDAVVIAGKVHRRVLRQSQTYMTSAGEVVVERTLYKDRKDEDGRCVSPMELALGIIGFSGGFWTPRAAQQALWVVELPPTVRIKANSCSCGKRARVARAFGSAWDGFRDIARGYPRQHGSPT
jgi:hypothetical protein